MQTTAIRTVANSLPENEVILLTLLISKRNIPLYRFTENQWKNQRTYIRRLPQQAASCYDTIRKKRLSRVGENVAKEVLNYEQGVEALGIYLPKQPYCFENEYILHSQFHIY